MQVKPGKHDFVRLFFGTINAGTDLYGPDVTVLAAAWPIDTTVTDEPSYREYFARIATATGRSVALSVAV